MKYSLIQIGGKWAVSVRKGGERLYFKETLTSSKLDAQQKVCVENIKHQNYLLQKEWIKLQKMSKCNCDGVFLESEKYYTTLGDLLC